MPDLHACALLTWTALGGQMRETLVLQNLHAVARIFITFGIRQNSLVTLPCAMLSGSNCCPKFTSTYQCQLPVKQICFLFSTSLRYNFHQLGILRMELKKLALSDELVLNHLTHIPHAESPVTDAWPM